MSNYRKAINRMDVSPGDSVRILRELQEMSQNDLAAATGIPQSTISAIENDRVRLGVDRAKVLAKARRYMPESTKSSAAIISERYEDKSYA